MSIKKGKYNLIISPKGNYSIEWHAEKDKKPLYINLPDFNKKLQEMVEEQLKNIRHFSKLYKLAFSKNSSEEFLNHPDSIILNYLDDKETTAVNKNMNKNQVLEFNIKKFLLAYNRWKNTKLIYGEVMEFCLVKK